MRFLIVLLVFVVGCREKVVEIEGTGSVDTGVIDTGEPVNLDRDGDGWDEDVDCDDQNLSIHPNADEICNGVDDDCDGEVDDNPIEAPTWYADGDGDGYGGDSVSVSACQEPVGHSATGGDCDDSDPAFHPGASESDCTDAADYNCDGSTGYADTDGDGFAACEDCDDTVLAVNEDAEESCNGIDDDCDGLTDSDDPGVVDAAVFYGDSDGDGHGGTQYEVTACEAPAGFVSSNDDCDDLDATSFPGGTEVCDESDNDCDLEVDEGVGLTWYADADGDGYGDASATQEACDAPVAHVPNGDDCDDTDASTSPASFEICDGVDNDCDGSADDSSAINASTWYLDSDGDGYGVSTSSQQSCTAPSGFVSTANDCDDSESGVNPGATEICDGVDQDCDGSVDDDAGDASTWYVDGDSDGYGDAAISELSCNQPGGHVADSTDCDDSTGSIYPGAAETCDGVDQDCDGVADNGSTDASTWYADLDSDGQGDPNVSEVSCNQPTDYVADNTDCDDSGFVDLDGDGTQNCADTDADGDGLDSDFDADDEDNTIVRGPTGGSGFDGNLTVGSGSVVVFDHWTRTSNQAAQGANTLDVNDSSIFNVGDEILLLAQEGSGVGQYQFLFVTAINTNTLDVVPALDALFDSGSLLQRVPHYNDVIVDSGGEIQGEDWVGSGGGVVVFRAAGNVQIDGAVSASGAGWRGGAGVVGNSYDPIQGESYTGLGSSGNSGNNGGGGGAYPRRADNGDSGGGGSYGAQGGQGTQISGNAVTNPGGVYGSSDLSAWYLGSGGGGGSPDTEGDGNQGTAGDGGDGGGLIAIYTAGTLSINGQVAADGGSGQSGNQGPGGGEMGGGGAGSGGQILLTAFALEISGSVRAEGGVGGNSTTDGGGNYGNAYGGDGGEGRIRLDYTTLNSVAFPGGDLSLSVPAAGHTSQYLD